MAALSSSDLKPNGPWFAFVGDVAGGVDQVHAVGPSGIGALGGVAKFVEHRGNLDAQACGRRLQRRKARSSSLFGLAKTTLSLILLCICQTSLGCASVM